MIGRVASGRGHRGHAGFSLVEILIAILVLALGLLGLGAVFPVVIAQQRDATDRTRGASAIEAIEALTIRGGEVAPWASMLEIVRQLEESPDDPDGVGDGLSDEPRDQRYTWQRNTFTRLQQTLYNQRGEMRFATPDAGIVQIPASARLFPQPFGDLQPQYVWDVVPRRVPGVDGSVKLQLAVFLRRIDAGIRVAAGKTLSEVLADPSEEVVPVALDARGLSNPDRLRPTGNGKGVYALPFQLRVLAYNAYETVEILGSNDVDNEMQRNDLMVLRGTGALLQAAADLASRPGQKLVDNTGTIREVRRRATQKERDLLNGLDDEEIVVVVEPPFAIGESFTRGLEGQVRLSENERASRVRQVIFTPQVPVQVAVVTIEE